MKNGSSAVKKNGPGGKKSLQLNGLSPIIGGMKISDIFKTQSKTFSFEFFPSKDYASTMALGINIGQLMHLSPSFISVTYGAGGSTQDMSFDLLDYIQNGIGITSMAHYTCVGATTERVTNDLNHLYERNIHNLMLLRGDPPKDAPEKAYTGEFRYASDLVRFAHEQERFSIGVAGYPEKHQEAETLDGDIDYLAKKVALGADFIVTQMFFDNEYYYTFVKKARAAGVTCRIIPGVMPITNFKQIARFAKISGSHISDEIIEKFRPYQDDKKKMYQIGIDLAILQYRELLENGAPGLHFYTLNKSHATTDIYESIPFDLKDTV